MKVSVWMVALVVSLSFFGLSCAGVSVSEDYDRSINFDSFKTYAWLPADKQAELLDKPRNPLIEKRLYAAIEKNLSMKGMKLVSVEQADLVIAYHGSTQEKQYLQQMGYGMGVSSYPASVNVNRFGNVTYADPYAMSDTAMVSYYKEGTLILDMYEKSTKDLVWRGTGIKVIGENLTPEKIDVLLDTTVTEMLKNFPPGVAATN